MKSRLVCEVICKGKNKAGYATFIDLDKGGRINVKCEQAAEENTIYIAEFSVFHRTSRRQNDGGSFEVQDYSPMEVIVLTPANKSVKS